MSKLVVSAEASPLFGNFLMCVSVSTESDGKPVALLKAKNFKIFHLASLNHAYQHQRQVKQVKEGVNGFYILELELKEYEQQQLPPGHYVFGVAVVTYTQVKKKGGVGSEIPKDEGQTIAVGDLPTYGQWS